MTKYPIRLIINPDGSRFEQQPFTVDEEGKSVKKILLDIVNELEKLKTKNHLHFYQIDDLIMQTEVNSVKEVNRDNSLGLSKKMFEKRNELKKIEVKYNSDIKEEKFKEVIDDSLFYISRFINQLKA